MPVVKKPIKTTAVVEDYQERRKSARLDIPIKVAYKVVGKKIGDDVSVKGAITKNISSGGCLLLVEEEIPEASMIELEIFLGENEKDVLRLQGSIVRLSRSGENAYEYGISFNEISREAKRLFADFCFAKMYELIGLSEWPTDKRVKK